GARGVQRAPELGAGLRRLVRLAGRRHPGVQPAGVEPDGAVRHVRRGGRLLRPPGTADASPRSVHGGHPQRGVRGYARPPGRPDQVPVPPADPRLPRQEKGVRPARTLPYRLHADARVSAASVRLRFGNAGTATAVFQARATAQDPRCYTVSPGRELSDDWAFTGSYDLAVHGPNGFFRRFAGTATGVRLDVRARYEGHPEEIALEVTNRGTDRIEVHVADRYGSRP